MNFGEAITLLKVGHQLQRKGWNGKDMWIGMQIPDAYSRMTLPYIYMRTEDEQMVSWVASQTDMLSDDWQEYVAPTQIKLSKVIEHVNKVFDKAYTLSQPRVTAMKKAGVWKKTSKRNAIIAKYEDLDAPYGRKKDGTPAKKKGRPFKGDAK